jgi:hypothetical protein
MELIRVMICARAGASARAVPFGAARWFVDFLSGLIRPKKLGLNPTFQVIALYQHPVPLALRNFEAFAFGDYPKTCRGEELPAPRCLAIPAIWL